MNEREFLLGQSLHRLYLTASAPKMRIVSDLMGLQAQFAANPRLSLLLRASDYTPEDWHSGLVKIWSHRGTMYVVPESELGLHLAALGRTGAFEDGWWGMTAAEMSAWSPFLLNQVRSGVDTRDALKEACRNAGMPDPLIRSAFYGWGGLIKELCSRGSLIGLADRPRVYRIPEPFEMPETAEARRIFLERYFRVFGPATPEDARSFFNHWSAAEIRENMEYLSERLSCFRLDGKTYYHIEPLIAEPEIPECTLVPGFDALVLGYRDRSRFLDDGNRRGLVNAAGIVFPAIIVRSRVRAAWKLENNTLRVTPFETLLKKDESAIKREVRRKFGRKTQIVFA